MCRLLFLAIAPSCPSKASVQDNAKRGVTTGLTRGYDLLLRQLNDFIGTETKGLRKSVKLHASPSKSDLMAELVFQDLQRCLLGRVDERPPVDVGNSGSLRVVHPFSQPGASSSDTCSSSDLQHATDSLTSFDCEDIPQPMRREGGVSTRVPCGI
ncbi:hypothetical protein EYF80_015532 [Liparis tanakae]|uniref:Uncharacterized protein n=1 Tax=Liparis tanakae TaxID=230148 RepID=A0A4Z2I8A5_9TELE|nr:hypothetical protein EYF80_015532 [Liparis tanakae]